MSLKIALSGINGHIGNNVARTLSQNGFQLVGLVRDSNKESIEDLTINLIRGDLFDESAMDKLCQGADVFIHLAAKVSIYPSEREEIFRTNIEGVKNVIAACIRNGVKKIIHFSSIHAHEAYGHAIPINENTKYVSSKSSAYDFSKSTGEQLMIKAREKAIDVTILNPTGVIGPFDFQPSLSGKMMMDIYSGNLPMLVKGGFDWVDVRDVSNAVLNVIVKDIKNEKFMLSGHWASLSYLAEIVSNEKGIRYKGGP